VVTISKQLGYLIRQLREIRSISQQKLSEISGLSQSFLSSIENGQKSPTIRSLTKLALALNVSPDELFKSAIYQEESIESLNKNELLKNINSSLAKLYKKILGKGPKSIKTDIYHDIIIVKIKRYTEPLFENLAKSRQGREILEDMGRVLFESNKRDIIKVISDLIKVKVNNIYYNFDKKEEFVIIIKFKDNIL